MCHKESIIKFQNRIYFYLASRLKFFVVLKVFCENIPTITNAFPNVQINNQSKYKTGTEIEYQCDIGYTSSSNSDSYVAVNNKVMCQDDGKWSETKFQCTSN